MLNTILSLVVYLPQPRYLQRLCPMSLGECFSNHHPVPTVGPLRGRVIEMSEKEGQIGLCGLVGYGTSSNGGYVIPRLVSSLCSFPELTQYTDKRLTTGLAQRTLASPLPHLQFLLALSSLNPSNATAASANSNSSSNSRAMPPPPAPPPVFPSTRSSPPSASSSKLHVQDIGTSNLPAADWKGKGKSKADMLSAWRTAQCYSLSETSIFFG